LLPGVAHETYSRHRRSAVSVSARTLERRRAEPLLIEDNHPVEALAGLSKHDAPAASLRIALTVCQPRVGADDQRARCAHPVAGVRASRLDHDH
jgi:hypothetical protein